MADTKDPKVQFMQVTPDMAKRWLESANIDNRNLSERQVERMARDIRSKAYPLTHEGIGFDVNGKLIDGQHRLAAIVAAGLPVTLTVATNLSPEAGFFIDQGRTRNFADVAKLRVGHPVSNKVGAVARAMLDPMMKCNSTRFEQVQFYMEHSDVIQKAIDAFRGSSPELCPSHVIAVCARALYHVDHMMIVRFADVIKDPIDANAKGVDRAAVMLREALIRTSDTKLDRRTIYRRAEYLLSAFIARNSRPSRTELARHEMFPIKGEGKPGKMKLAA